MTQKKDVADALLLIDYYSLELTKYTPSFILKTKFGAQRLGGAFALGGFRNAPERLGVRDVPAQAYPGGAL